MAGYSRVKAVARRDDNEPEIIKALEKAGAYVVQVSATGLPDLCVGYQGRWFWMEVKAPKGKLRASQESFFDACKLWGLNAAVVRSGEEAVAVLEAGNG